MPRTAAWGYPEPYTRDLLIASLGILVSGNQELVASLRRVLRTLARNQSPLGHVPSLVDAPEDRGASDTTPLFLLALALYRETTGERGFLAGAARKALAWMSYQSPDDTVMVAQQPTSDWRDEQWVEGFGLFVNTLVYAYLRLHALDERAETLKRLMNRIDVRGRDRHPFVHEGLTVPHKPYFALWSYKIHNSERFDLLGNSLAVLAGIAAPSRSRKLVAWVERECASLRDRGLLTLQLPPCLFPYIRPSDSDWRRRYAQHNAPGEYHNGGVWPFACGFYVAALVAVGHLRLAEKRLLALTELVQPARDADVLYGFNEWFKAQDGRPRGQDWQTWSAAMFLYAAECVATGRTPFFDEIRHARPAR
ncbi:MAG: amylo-alpha-1,6-glucosidase [Acidobacteriia bacterium]|nr:amylo-alpha-1,6-glucosidase [Terriglobia bacterium]